MIPSKMLPTDLRELVEQHSGKPLASNANASLWRCPSCPPEAHSLLMVSANQVRCLGRYACDGGASEWMQNIAEPTDAQVEIGAPA